MLTISTWQCNVSCYTLLRIYAEPKQLSHRTYLFLGQKTLARQMSNYCPNLAVIIVILKCLNCYLKANHRVYSYRTDFVPITKLVTSVALILASVTTLDLAPITRPRIQYRSCTHLHGPVPTRHLYWPYSYYHMTSFKKAKAKVRSGAGLLY